MAADRRSAFRARVHERSRDRGDAYRSVEEVRRRISGIPDSRELEIFGAPFELGALRVNNDNFSERSSLFPRIEG